MSIIGKPMDRTDGVLKVTGDAPYASDFTEARMAHAVLVTSTVARAHVKCIATEEAECMPGVHLVMTHKNAPRLPGDGRPPVNAPTVRRLSLFQDNRVNYNNEPIAVVVADTLAQAIDAANHVRVEYEHREPVLDFDEAKAAAYTPADTPDCPADTVRGNVEQGLSRSDVRVDAVYTTPLEHHNPMEPHATLACWSGSKLTVVDATQAVNGVKATLVATLGLAEDDVRVVSPFLGGGFGTKGSPWSHVVLCAMVARQVGRPVKLVLTRPQMFGSVGGRPNTQQYMTLGAKSDGALTALQHNSFSYTSMLEDWFEPACLPSRNLYAIPNQITTHRIAQLNLGTPTLMRAPGQTTGSFALESAMDELAVELGMCPLELRLRNYADFDPQEFKPWSSKNLKECYTVGASKFGWSSRNPTPGATKNGNKLIGHGMATALYQGNRSDASAIVRVFPDGTATVGSATHDIGTGTYTVMAQVAAQALGFPLDKVCFELGDTKLPKAPDASSSQSAASVSPAVYSACVKARSKLLEMAVADPESPVRGVADATIVDGWIVSKGNPKLRDAVGAVLARAGSLTIEATGSAAIGRERDKYSIYSFGAVFVEVQVDEDLGTVEVTRVVGVYDLGRILNQKTAHSQLMGGIVWGISAALHEETLLDTCSGRFVNGNLAEYMVAVNADIGDIDVTMLDRPDPYINSLGVRGAGELGITGIIAAVANAVYNATGVRVRDLPITLDKLL
jgi:xanthine dehydrogenase YagR molybdenum-binding subunit